MKRNRALALFREYNRDSFLLRHALTMEGVMKYFSRTLGYADTEEFWGIAGLLHDIDFEQFPEQHCIKAKEILREAGAGASLIHAVCSHGYNLMVSVEPKHQMEKVLYATDELTGLIWAVSLMRPSRNVQDLELGSVRRKYKNKGFATGCSRKVIEAGAAMLDWTLDELIEKTILAMRSCEEFVSTELEFMDDDTIKESE